MIVQSFSFTMNYVSNQADYADVPPDLERFTIQKINPVLSTGENVIIRPTFSHFDTMPQTLYLFTGQDSFAFRDDGAYPDNEANDHEYAAFMEIDIEDFLLDVENRENELETMEQFIVFEGHEGHFEDSLPPFDLDGFNSHIEVDVQPKLILADQCDATILKQNSLFITHLDVVEDPTRTYYPVDGTGTPNGIWTFGKFMTNMANTSGGSGRPSTSNFIKHWLKSYVTTVNKPNNISPNDKQAWRNNIVNLMIVPWISKANGRTISQGRDNTIDIDNWEARWDDAETNHPGELVKNAPFKLTAIANRLDQRNNTGFTNRIINAGETRFIFTLINLYTSTGTDHNVGEIGEPPRNIQHGGSPDFIDWRGMNVIFEFGNVQTNLCDLKAFGQAWLNLSAYNLTDEMDEYLDALEAITETVINANAVPGKPNGSALNQFRTNEKIFSNTVSTSINNFNEWDAAAWQFRQFEISATTHHLERVSLNNTPIAEDFNVSYNTEVTGVTPRGGIHAQHLTEWVYRPSNQVLIKLDKHKIPKTFNGITLLEEAADVDAEYSFYWDLLYMPIGFSIPNYSPSAQQIANNTQNKENGKLIRHHLSLNTCQGCHTGETKTLFTMVTPLKKGDAAEYWTSPPHTTSGKLDVRTVSGSFTFGVSKNTGTTVIGDQSTASAANRFLNYPVPTTSTRDFVSVSPFITGRNWDGSSWADDEPSTDPKIEKYQDNDMRGLFFVNDPGNVTDPSNQTSSVNNYFGMDYKRHGFNELELRKINLCQLVNLNCVPTVANIADIFDLISNLSHKPLSE